MRATVEDEARIDGGPQEIMLTQEEESWATVIDGGAQVIDGGAQVIDGGAQEIMLRRGGGDRGGGGLKMVFAKV